METLFNLAARNAELEICGTCIRTKKANKENVFFLHDKTNARKMQMSTLDHELRENGKENTYLRDKTEILKITLALSSTT